MKFVGNITLSSSGPVEMPDRHFEDQLLDVQPESQSGRIAIDGRLHVTTYPKRVIWHGGSAAALRDMAHVRIVWRGCTVIDEDIAGEPETMCDGASFALKRFVTE